MLKVNGVKVASPSASSIVSCALSTAPGSSGLSAPSSMENPSTSAPVSAIVTPVGNVHCTRTSSDRAAASIL